MFHLPLSLLLIVTLHNDLHSRSVSEVPLLMGGNTVRLASPRIRDGDPAEPDAVCGIECQRDFPEPGSRELERLLAYETFYENGTRTVTEVEFRDVRNTSITPPIVSRRKWQVYGTDGRFVITDKRFVTSFPFSAAVKLSTGCSGILVSPKHVLAAAHCLHDGHAYRRELKRLRVGAVKPQRNKAGGRSKRKQKKRKGKKRKSQRKTSEQQSFHWTRVRRTYVPQGWMSNVGKEMALDYDYALLELKRKAHMKHMELGVAPHITRLHFSGYDDDHAGKVVYRFCSVTQESNDLMYQRCDAQTCSSGAGVYVRLRNASPKAEGAWRRKVIGVFSGHRSVKEGNRHIHRLQHSGENHSGQTRPDLPLDPRRRRALPFTLRPPSCDSPALSPGSPNTSRDPYHHT